MSNPFDQYNITPEKHTIAALGAEVTLKKLTLAESQSFLDKAVKGMDSDDNPIIDIKAMQDSQFDKVSMGLVDPKMTSDQLRNLGIGAKDAIAEILDIVDPLPKVDGGKD